MAKITGIILSSGHTNVKGKDMGASSTDGKYIEGVLAVQDKNLLVTKLKEVSQKKGIDINKYLLIDRDDTPLADTMAFLKGRTKPNDLLLEIHYNAGPAAAKGTEALVPENPTEAELEIADRITDIVSIVLGTVERGSRGRTDGVKDESESNRGRLGWMRLTGINVLLEVEFISNPAAMAVVDKKREYMWEEVAKYLVGILE
jgi:N-acetylmuramoyl-L-alanine amidase